MFWNSFFLQAYNPELDKVAHELVFDTASRCLDRMMKAYTHYQQQGMNMHIRMVDNQGKIVITLDTSLNEYQFTNQLSI